MTFPLRAMCQPPRVATMSDVECRRKARRFNSLSLLSEEELPLRLDQQREASALRIRHAPPTFAQAFSVTVNFLPGEDPAAGARPRTRG